MRSTDKFSYILPASGLLLALALMLFSSRARAVPLDSGNITGRTFTGRLADHEKIACSMTLGSTRKSPSNKRMRNVQISANGNTWSLLDLDPKPSLHLVQYSPNGWLGYDVFFRNYGSDNHYMRVWMSSKWSNRIPISVQLFSESKKTGVKRLIVDCVYLY